MTPGSGIVGSSKDDRGLLCGLDRGSRCSLHRRIVSKIDVARRREFSDRGLIRIEGLIPIRAVEEACEKALEILEREGAWRAGAWVDDAPVDWVRANHLQKKLKPLARTPAFMDLQTDAVRSVAEELAEGRALHAPVAYPQILLTPPNALAWSVPHDVWHLDSPRLGKLGRPGVQMWTFLRELPPGAGGTLLVAGSHRLLNDRGVIKSKDVKRLLRREAWFRALFQPGLSDRRRFLDEEGRVGEVDVQVVELHGEPGDVVLTDMRLLHTLAPNASRTLRLMLTQRFNRDFGAELRAAAEAKEPGREEHSAGR